MSRRSALRLGTLLVPVVLVSACVPQNLSFRVDTRLHITSPKDRSEVTLPLNLTWTMRDFAVKSTATGEGGSFAIFVDRSPVPPGKGLDWLARHDSECQRKPACPDATYLAQLGVYQTTDTRLVITSLEEDPSSKGNIEHHDATIVLLDDAGRRIGEIAWTVDFDLKRKA